MANGAEARVIALPVKAPEPPSCWTCKNARFGGPLTICAIVGESILDERSAAADCDEYEPEER